MNAHARIEELGNQLMSIVDTSSQHPTAEEYKRLKSIRGKIKRLVVTSGGDETDRQSLLIISNVKISRQDSFFRMNNNRWSKEAA